ncbi:MAG: hypothetical protein IPJ59_01145 [Nannocystis sp.]|nr:hypothetical protein [Nannocystis sp.]
MPLAPAGPLRLALETPIPTLDPAAASDTVSRRITSQIFDTLLDWDPAGTSLRPELLAELPVISDDGLTITMTLRSGPDARRFAADTCLEGQPRRVRASDVAASLLRIDPARHAAYALLADRIVGLDEHHRTRATVPGIRADDASNTITLQLTRPQPELPAILASPMLAIVPPECIAYYDGRDLEHPPFARHPVGSGPYVLDHARSELPREVLLLRSPEAPASDRLAALGCPQLPGASPVALTHFHDPEPALRSFQAGELAAIAPGQSQFAELVADPSTRGAALNQSQLADPSAGRLRPGAAPPGSQLLRFPTLATDLLVFRMRDPELGQHPDPAIDAQHRALRQAVALAFDAVRYQRVIRNDAWATQRARIVPKGLGGALDDAVLHRFAPPAADLPQARQILAAADIRRPPRAALLDRHRRGRGPGGRDPARRPAPAGHRSPGHPPRPLPRRGARRQQRRPAVRPPLRRRLPRPRQLPRPLHLRRARQLQRLLRPRLRPRLRRLHPHPAGPRARPGRRRPRAPARRPGPRAADRPARGLVRRPAVAAGRHPPPARRPAHRAAVPTHTRVMHANGELPLEPCCARAHASDASRGPAYRPREPSC